jgi:DNA-binding FadR family transcriptional regulator
MYVIEILLKNTAMPMSVQRKTIEEATTIYQQVLAAMRSHDPSLLELACDRQPEKKIAVMTDSIVAAQIYEKSGAAASGKTPGFVSFVEAAS